MKAKTPLDESQAAARVVRETVRRHFEPLPADLGGGVGAVVGLRREGRSADATLSCSTHRPWPNKTAISTLKTKVM